MTNLFKQEYLRYALFLVGAVLIFLWARNRRVEGFLDSPEKPMKEANAPYNFEMYFADWCPHCHHALPEFKKLGATQTIGAATVACKAIDAEKNPELVRGKVKGYPTIQLYGPQGQLIKEYSGERTYQGFRHFLEDALNKK